MRKNSASQINTFRDCQRKWALRVIAGLPSPSSPAAELGTEVDEGQLQPYLRDGREFELGRASGSGEIAASALEWLPEPKLPGLEVQKHFVLGSCEGEWGYQGYKDLWLPDHKVLKYLPPGGDWGAVVDFKTTGDFKWAKTETSLGEDVQAQLYAMDAMVATGARTMDLVWIYMRTRGARKSKKVHLRVVADHVGEQFEKIEATSKEMFALRDEAGASGMTGEEFALSLKPNPEMCSGYGGCPYQHVCNLSPSQKRGFVEALSLGKKENGMGSLDLFATLEKKVVAPVMGMSDRDVPAPPPDVVPAAFREPEAPAVVGINPPEKELPPAPPVGIASSSGAGEDKPKPAKRGRPKKAVEPTVVPDGKALVAEMEQAAGAAYAAAKAGAEVRGGSSDFEAAWERLGAAVQVFLKEVE